MIKLGATKIGFRYLVALARPLVSFESASADNFEPPRSGWKCVRRIPRALAVGVHQVLNSVDRVHSEHDTFKSPMKKNPVLLVFSHVLLGFALTPVLAQTPTPAPTATLAPTPLATPITPLRDRLTQVLPDRLVTFRLLAPKANSVAIVETHYNISDEPRERAIAGLSMGGLQSIETGIVHLGYFRWIGAFSPGVRPAALS